METNLFLGIPVWKWGAASALMIARLAFFGVVPAIAMLRAGRVGLNRAPLRAEQLRNEFAVSLLSLLMQLLSFYLMRVLVDHGVSRLYVDPLEHGVLWLVVQIPIFIVLVDAAFYGLHRWMHTPWMMKRFHRVHHRSRDISPLTNLCMHPLESFLQVSLGVLIALALPVNETVITLIGLWLFAYNFYLHSAREYFPKHWLETPGLRWICSSTYHHLHHTHPNTNFGVYLRIWDRFFRTEHLRYAERFGSVSLDPVKTRGLVKVAGGGVRFAVERLRRFSEGLRFARKFTVLVSVLAAYFVTSLFHRSPLRKFRALSWFAGGALRGIGIRVEADPELARLASEARIVVSNHHSYLDIPIIASLVPSQFISTVEARRLPFFGFLIERMGCLLIDRNAKTLASRAGEIASMRSALDSGNTITFFPESMSTPGDRLLTFHRRFFEPAFESGAKALCLTIRWMSVDGEPLRVENRGKVLWWRQNPIFAHVMGLCRLREVRIHVAAGLVSPATCSDAKAFATACRELVAQRWLPVEGARLESLRLETDARARGGLRVRVPEYPEVQVAGG